MERPMPKLDPATMRKVERAAERYLREIDESFMTENSKETYRSHVENFVRWLNDDFEPGGTLVGPRFRV